jgi:group I intron endonuclease
MKESAIYKIQSIIKPECFYIGCALWVNRRWNSHLSHLRKNKHHSLNLQNHYNNYGEADLIHIIVEPCLPQFLLIREQYYLNILKPYFNTNLFTEGGWLGHKHSDETKRKISKAKMGNIPWNKGKKTYPLSKATKEKLSKSHKGKKLSEETKRKISENGKGRKDSKESNRKRSISLKGRIFSDAHKLHLSEARKKDMALRKFKNTA